MNQCAPLLQDKLSNFLCDGEAAKKHVEIFVKLVVNCPEKQEANATKDKLIEKYSITPMAWDKTLKLATGVYVALVLEKYK